MKNNIAYTALVLAIISLVATTIIAYNLYQENQKIKKEITTHEELVNGMVQHICAGTNGQFAQHQSPSNVEIECNYGGYGGFTFPTPGYFFLK